MRCSRGKHMGFPMIWNLIDRSQHIFKNNTIKKCPNFLWGVYNHPNNATTWNTCTKDVNTNAYMYTQYYKKNVSECNGMK